MRDSPQVGSAIPAAIPPAGTNDTVEPTVLALSAHRPVDDTRVHATHPPVAAHAETQADNEVTEKDVRSVEVRFQPIATDKFEPTGSGSIEKAVESMFAYQPRAVF